MVKIQDIDIKKAFYMEPKEIIDYFQSKGLKTSFDWYDLYEDAHARAFTVAKMTNADLLNDTQSLINKALKEGWSEGHFKREAKNLFANKGWTGFKEVVNPKTGEKQTIELGSPRRIKTIFQNNINSAYAVGRYKQQLEDVDIAPYWQYECVLDGRTRPEHSAMHGKVFRYDDPIWQSIYPPNGWGCRCSVRNLSQRQLDKKGLQVESSEGCLREINKTVGGEDKTVTAYDFNVGGKKYTLAPDAGWSTNIGQHVWNIDVLAYKKIEKLPQEVKDRFISDMAQNIHNNKIIKNLINKTINNNLKPQNIEKTISWLKPNVLYNLYKENVIPKTPIIIMQDNRIGHIIGEVKIDKQKLSREQFSNIYNYINNADEIYLDKKGQNLIFLSYLPKNEIIDNRDVIKTVIKLARLKKGKPVNYLATSGRVNKDTIIKDKNLKKIE